MMSVRRAVSAAVAIAAIIVATACASKISGSGQFVGAPTGPVPSTAPPNSPSDVPTSDAPSSDVPTSDSPTSDAPTSDEPSSSGPLGKLCKAIQAKSGSVFSSPPKLDGTGDECSINDTSDDDHLYIVTLWDTFTVGQFLDGKEKVSKFTISGHPAASQDNKMCVVPHGGYTTVGVLGLIGIYSQSDTTTATKILQAALPAYE